MRVGGHFSQNVDCVYVHKKWDSNVKYSNPFVPFFRIQSINKIKAHTYSYLRKLRKIFIYYSIMWSNMYISDSYVVEFLFHNSSVLLLYRSLVSESILNVCCPLWHFLSNWRQENWYLFIYVLFLSCCWIQRTGLTDIMRTSYRLILLLLNTFNMHKRIGRQDMCYTDKIGIQECNIK